MSYILQVPASTVQVLQMFRESMKNMARTRTNKSLKIFSSIAKTLKGGLHGKILETFEGLFNILKLLDPILKPIAAMIKVFIGELLVELIPHLMKISAWLMLAIPYVRIAGRETGKFFSWFIDGGAMIQKALRFLNDFSMGLVLFADNFKGPIEMVQKTVHLFKEFSIGLVLFTNYFNYLKERFGIFFDLIKSKIIVFQAIHQAFKSMLDGIKGVANGIIKIIRKFIDKINDIPGVNIPKPSYLHSGTPSVPQTGAYWLKKGETVSNDRNKSQGSGDVHIHLDLRDAIIDNKERFAREIAEKVKITLW